LSNLIAEDPRQGLTPTAATISDSKSDTSDPDVGDIYNTPKTTPEKPALPYNLYDKDLGPFSEAIADTEQKQPIQAFNSDINHTSTHPEHTQDLVNRRESDLVTSEFREELVSSLLVAEDDAMYLLFNTVFQKKKQIRIIDAGDTVYTLRPDLSIFGSQRVKNAPDTSYRALSRGEGTLTSSQKESNRKAKKRNKSDPLHHDHCFLPLGWLSESQKVNTNEAVSPSRDMKYLVGLNVSTTPKSLWLIYSYSLDDDGHDDYSDNGNVPVFEGPVNDDIALYHRPDSYNYAARATDDEVNGSGSNTSRLFPLSYEFDVGQICEDIKTWDPSQGLTRDTVTKSISEKHYLKGNSLYLKAVDPPSSDDLHLGKSEIRKI
jgi:hypothetical protein